MVSKNYKIDTIEKKGCFGKDKYKSKLAAEYVFDNFKGRANAILEIYKCTFCNNYHIGHNKKHELASKQNEKRT